MAKSRVFLVLGAVLLAAATGSAQSVKGRPKTPAPKTAPAKAGPAAPAKDTASSSNDSEPAASAAAPAMTGRGEAKTPSSTKAPAGDGGVTVVEKGGAKQFQFTETDVEGRLKVPQLVYFLRRVRAEFAAGDLGHRSFMRELSETQRDPDF